MLRHEGWFEDLQAYLTTVRFKPFSWVNGFDCCSFTADGVKAMTGEDFLADQRGRYSDAPGAYRLLQKDFGGGIIAMMEEMERRHGLIPTPPFHAQRGDIVILPPAGDMRFDGTLGLCVGTISLFVHEENGLMGTSTIPNPGAEGISRAWRIPINEG